MKFIGTSSLVPLWAAQASPAFFSFASNSNKRRPEAVAVKPKCGADKRLQVCFAQDVTPSFVPLLGNIRENLSAIAIELEDAYPGSQFAFGEFR